MVPELSPNAHNHCWWQCAESRLQHSLQWWLESLPSWQPPQWPLPRPWQWSSSACCPADRMLPNILAQRPSANVINNFFFVFEAPQNRLVLIQGVLAEGEGSVELTSLSQLVFFKRLKVLLIPSSSIKHVGAWRSNVLSLSLQLVFLGYSLQIIFSLIQY